MHISSRKYQALALLLLIATALLMIHTPPPALAMGSKPSEARQSGGQAWAEPLRFEWAENLHKVTPELYRAGQPSAEAMRNYEKMGIKTIINLRSRNSDVERVEGTNLKLVEIPIKTTRVDDDAMVIKVLQSIRDAEKPVLIHCQHGADRTGLMMAAYRVVEQDWTREEALKELREGGYGFHSIWGHIPEYVQNMDAEKIRKALH